MEIKKEFSLLKGTDNIVNISENLLNSYLKKENSSRRVRAILKLHESKITNFAKKEVINFVEGNPDKFYVVSFDKYILPLAYNSNDDSIIINLKPFNVEEVSNLSHNTLFSCLLYGMSFRNLVSGKIKIRDSYYPIITNYFTSILIRLFGKQFGLLGRYSSEILTLKFLTSSYILASFFGIERDSNWKKSSSISNYDYREIKDDLQKYDFSDIGDYIKALNDFKVMPGMNKYRFTEKFLKMFSINFLPALEDCSRFIASIGGSSVSGNQLIPHFIRKYNEQEYEKLLDLVKYSLR